jgi:hypothetical protein
VSDTKEKREEITEEEKRLLEDEKIKAARETRMLERQEILVAWAKKPANFIAIVLLFIFFLMIAFSVLFRPPTNLQPQPRSISTNTR